MSLITANFVLNVVAIATEVGIVVQNLRFLFPVLDLVAAIS